MEKIREFVRGKIRETGINGQFREISWARNTSTSHFFADFSPLLSRMIRFCKGPVRPSQDFLHVPAASGSPQSVELLAQVRPSGRILDASRVVIGGDEVIDVDVNLFNAVPSPRLAGWKLRFQTWPRDIVIRRNQATSAWIDLEALIAGRDAEVFDREGAGIPANEVLGLLGELESPNAAALRWAVVLGDDSELHLQLQALPASAPVLDGKPALRK